MMQTSKGGLFKKKKNGHFPALCRVFLLRFHQTPIPSLGSLLIIWLGGNYLIFFFFGNKDGFERKTQESQSPLHHFIPIETSTGISEPEGAKHESWKEPNLSAGLATGRSKYSLSENMRQ